MLIDFFFLLRSAKLSISLTEFMGFLEALDNGVGPTDPEGFYRLARLCLVKDESQFDRFDRVFKHYFEAVEAISGPAGEIPAEWLRRQSELHLSEEERQRIESLGGWEKLMETLRKRLEEQSERHQGGSKWIGTGGTSPFGAYGYNPEGVRIGQDRSRHRRAVKVWDKREFANLASDRELGTRNVKMALRRLREFARTGAEEIPDIDATIRATAKNGGLLDLKLVPERHNTAKVLLFFDVGGSMDDHVHTCETLFTAASSEFKHLRYFYFHNCVYESVWTDNHRRAERIPTMDVIHTYGSDYKLIFVGDATMSPYEIVYPGGSVEHWNDESGEHWLRRLLEAYPKAAWLNPQPLSQWRYTHSIKMLRALMGERMYALNPEGIAQAMDDLTGRRH